MRVTKSHTSQAGALYTISNFEHPLKLLQDLEPYGYATHHVTFQQIQIILKDEVNDFEFEEFIRVYND